MASKPKTPQPRAPKERQQRDYFQTPPYAVDLLVPFIPDGVRYIWEPACGGGMMVERLSHHGYAVVDSDIEHGDPTRQVDFLAGDSYVVEAIITNPPFSLKREFAEQCMAHGLPWAFLIPADFNVWLCETIRDWKCRIVMPTRRIDYITPTGKSGKDSQAQFHSMWLTWQFAVPHQLTVVELTNETKRGLPPVLAQLALPA